MLTTRNTSAAQRDDIERAMQRLQPRCHAALQHTRAARAALAAATHDHTPVDECIEAEDAHGQGAVSAAASAWAEGATPLLPLRPLTALLDDIRMVRDKHTDAVNVHARQARSNDSND